MSTGLPDPGPGTDRMPVSFRPVVSFTAADGQAVTFTAAADLNGSVPVKTASKPPLASGR